MTFIQCKAVIESKLYIWGLEPSPDSEEIRHIDAAIGGLSPEMQKLLESRYRLAKTWECVACELHKELKIIYEMRDRIIAILAYRFGFLDGVESMR
jgi:hypothetical protein